MTYKMYCPLLQPQGRNPRSILTESNICGTQFPTDCTPQTCRTSDKGDTSQSQKSQGPHLKLSEWYEVKKYIKSASSQLAMELQLCKLAMKQHMKKKDSKHNFTKMLEISSFAALSDLVNVSMMNWQSSYF